MQKRWNGFTGLLACLRFPDARQGLLVTVGIGTRIYTLMVKLVRSSQLYGVL